MTVCSAPPRSRTPSTTSRSDPMPSIRAPIFTSRRLRSWTCGSRAALKISVRPSASTAARRMFSVPVTVGRSKTIRAPRSRSASAMISVSVSTTCAPIWRRPRRCCSTRRAPMSSPPGRGRRARPNRPSSAPSNRIVALIRRPSSAGTSRVCAPAILRRISPSLSGGPPSPDRISAITTVSRTLGTLLSLIVPVVNSAAAISGSAAFFDPLMQMLPASCAPPVIRSARCRVPRATGRDLAAAHSREAQAGFRHRQRVLELDLFGRAQRTGQLLLRAAARLLGTLDRDFAGVLGHIRQDGDAVGQHLEEATSHEEHLLGSSIHLLNPQRPGLEDRHEGGVAREHAQLAVRAVGDDELDVALEKAPLNADDPEWELQLLISLPPQGGDQLVPSLTPLCAQGGPPRSGQPDGGCCSSDSCYEAAFFFISSPWARASSIVPTM